MGAFFLYKHSREPLEPSVLNSISAKLVHFSHVATDRYENNDIQMVYTINKSDRMRIFKHNEKGLTFFLQGNIFESSSDIEKIGAANEEYSLENQIIKRYLSRGISSCTGLNGLYNLFVVDEKQGLLETAGDRLGVFQVFYAPLGNKQFALTSDIITLKLIPSYMPKISQRGIFDLLYMGVAYENRTVLERVERLLPNACYRISNAQLTLLEKFNLPFSKERWGYITPELLDELEYYYVRAIKRQLKPQDKILFFQSGGKDTRVFSSFLKKARIIPYCITAGENHHGEVYCARNVSQQLGFPWRRIPVSQNFNFIYADDFLQVDSLSCRFFSPWVFEVAEKLKDNWDYVISTLLGDPIFGSVIQKVKLEKENTPLAAFENYLDYWRPGFFSERELMELFPQHGREWVSEYKKEAFELFKSLGEKPYQMISAYAFRFNDRFKVGSVLRSMSAVLPVRLPCVDNDLMDFTFSLPPSFLHKRLLLDIYLIQRNKYLAAIPFDANHNEYSALIRAFKPELRCKLWQAYVTRIKIPVLKFLDPVNATTQFYVSIFSLHDKGFQKLKNRVHNFLPFLDGILDVSKTEEIFEERIPSGKDHIMPGNRIRSLLSAILAVEAFMDRISDDIS